MDSRMDSPVPMLFVLAAALSACAQQQQASHPTAEAMPEPQNQPAAPAPAPNEGNLTPNADQGGTATNEPDEEATADDAATSETGATAPLTAVSPEEASAQGLMEICTMIEARAKAKCTSAVAEMYRSSCNYYRNRIGTCTEEARRTLECQHKAADDVFCAHGVGRECGQVNSDLKLCQSGTATPEQSEPENDHTLPPGWERIEDPELGFSVAMPPGAELDPESKRRTWKAVDGDITYYVAEVEPPRAELGNRTYVRTVVSYVGAGCQRGLKLRGELELKGTTVIQYHSGCPDGTEWDGMLHFWNGKVVSTGYRAPAGRTGVREPFFYSFSVAR